MNAVPRGIELGDVRSHLQSLPHVTAVHDLHVWAMSTTENALTAHLVYPGGFPGDACLRDICARLRAEHAIGHVTIQVETGQGGDGCPAADSHEDEAATGLEFKPSCGVPVAAAAAARSHPARP